MGQKKILLTLAGLNLLLIPFMNCSGKGLNKISSTAPPSSPGSVNSTFTPNPSTSGEEYGTADMSGQILAYQDLQFKFKIPNFQSGAVITPVNLPSWLTVDSAAGELAGVPPSPQTYANLQIQVKVGSQIRMSGPYSLRVIGDPMKAYQWHLKNSGQTNFAGSAGVSGQDIHLDQTVRGRTLGQNIKVAVSDTGFLESHPSLNPNLLAGASRNYLNNFTQLKTWLGSSSPDTATAEDAHGTGVAGLIAERGWLGTGGRGVAPLAKVAGFLFIQAQDKLAASGLLTVGLLDQFQGDFDIFNYSWGDSQCGLLEYDQVLRDKQKLGVTNGRAGKGVIYLKASGNDFVGALSDCYTNVATTAYFIGNSNFSEDSNSPYEITVSALNAEGVSSSYSSPGSNIWVSSPGGEYGFKAGSTTSAVSLKPAILTTDFQGCDKGIKTFSNGKNDFDDGAAPNAACDHMATFNGTSAATPITSGAVALLLSANPGLSWRDVKHILATTADKVDPNAGNTTHPASTLNLTGHVYQQGWVTNAAGIPFHNWYGFGRVNVDRAVTAARTYVSALGTQKETNTGATWKYDSGNVNATLAGGTATGLTRTLSVAENYKIEGVQVRLKATNCVGALGVELTSPMGTKSILMNINSQILDSTINGHIFLSNAFYNENSAGTWTLKLINARSGCTATWNNWQLNVIGH